MIVRKAAGGGGELGDRDKLEQIYQRRFDLLLWQYSQQILKGLDKLDGLIVVVGTARSIFKTMR